MSNVGRMGCLHKRNKYTLEINFSSYTVLRIWRTNSEQIKVIKHHLIRLQEETCLEIPWSFNKEMSLKEDAPFAPSFVQSFAKKMTLRGYFGERLAAVKLQSSLVSLRLGSTASVQYQPTVEQCWS